MESNAQSNSLKAEKKAQVLIAKREKHARPLEVDPSTYWWIIGCTGLALLLVGGTDLALLWYPLRFGSPEWEFGTISAHFDGLPLVTIGAGALAVGVLGLGWRWAVKTVAVLLGLLALLNLAAFIIYLLDVPVALGGVAPQLLPTLKKAMLKTSAFAVFYCALYFWLATFLWRVTRPEEGASGQT